MDDDDRLALAGVADIVSRVMVQKAFSGEQNDRKRKRNTDTTEESEDEEEQENDDGEAGEGPLGTTLDEHPGAIDSR